MSRRTMLSCVTGQWVRESVKWLKDTQCGCCSIRYATDRPNDWYVCIGWHDFGAGRDSPDDDGYHIAWKVGRQSRNNVMQSDLDVDFEMPCNPDTGDVDDTLEGIDVVAGRPSGYESWAKLAARMREEAMRVWNEWREKDDDEEG